MEFFMKLSFALIMSVIFASSGFAFNLEGLAESAAAVAVGVAADSGVSAVTGFSSEERNDWENLGVDLADAKICKEKGITPQDFRPWNRREFSCSEADGWSNIQVSPSSASLWRDNGFSFSEAEPWIENGYEQNQANKYRRKGYTADSAKKAELKAFADQRKKEERIAAEEERKLQVLKEKYIKQRNANAAVGTDSAEESLKRIKEALEFGDYSEAAEYLDAIGIYNVLLANGESNSANGLKTFGDNETSIKVSSYEDDGFVANLKNTPLYMYKFRNKGDYTIAYDSLNKTRYKFEKIGNCFKLVEILM
jgi:hypothetical protein